VSLVWYSIEHDMIFTDWQLDCAFFALLAIDPSWDNYELLGEL